MLLTLLHQLDGLVTGQDERLDGKILLADLLHQVLDGNTMKDWLAVDADGSYSKDENQWNERVKEYVANLAAAIDTDRKSTRLNSSHSRASRMPSSA